MPEASYNYQGGINALLTRPKEPIIDWLGFARGQQMRKDTDRLDELRRLQGLRESDWEEQRNNRLAARDLLTPYLNEAQRITAEGGDVGEYYENLKKNIGSNPKFMGMSDQAQAMFHQGLNSALTSKLQAAVKAGNVADAERYSRMTGTPVNLAPVYAGYGDVHNTIRVLKQANPNWDIRASDDGNTVYINGQAHDTGRWLNAIANNNYAAEQAAASQRAEAVERQQQLYKAIYPDQQGVVAPNVENPNPNAGTNNGAANGAAPAPAAAPVAGNGVPIHTGETVAGATPTPADQRAVVDNMNWGTNAGEGPTVVDTNYVTHGGGNYGDAQWRNSASYQNPFLYNVVNAAGLDTDTYSAQQQLAAYADDPTEALNFRRLTGMDLPEIFSNPKGYQVGNNNAVMKILEAYNQLRQYPNSRAYQKRLTDAVAQYKYFYSQAIEHQNSEAAAIQATLANTKLDAKTSEELQNRYKNLVSNAKKLQDSLSKDYK